MTAAPPPPPPPPPPPGGPDDPMGMGGEHYDYEDEQLDTGAPAVAASKGKAMAVLGVVGAVVVFLLYSIFSGGDQDDQSQEPNVIEVSPDTVSMPSLPDDQEPLLMPNQEGMLAQPDPVLPEPDEAMEEPPFALPQEEEESTPPPLAELPPFSPPEPASPAPPPPVPFEPIMPIMQENDSLTFEQRMARQRSPMMLMDNAGGGGFLGGGRGSGTSGSSAAAIDGDPNRAFAEAASINTEVPRSVATRIGDMRRVIAQGRIIQATLETVINTDLPATIRAIVSRDVYGEAGNVPLIPKGSRLVGTYSTSIESGQSRVFVVWQRIIRPDGIDIMVGSPSTDGIGQAGLTGQIDTKFQEILSRSILSSIMSIGFALLSDNLNEGENNNASTTVGTVGTTQEGNAASLATINQLNRLGSVTEQFLTRFIDVRPTILVDQGSPVSIIVNRDLVFPSDITGAININ